jgi:putative flavoprotein involved in K+ transport
MILLGHITGADDSCLRFSPDLEASLVDGDRVFASFVESVDRYIEKNGLRCDPSDARRHGGDESLREHVPALDLAQAGISSIVWATGFSRHCDWIESFSIVAGCDPVHVRGVSTQPGLFFLGLRWLYTRRSNFIDGAGADAAYVRDQILRRAGQN